MGRLTPIFVLCIAFTNYLFAQCPDSNMTLDTQTEVDDYISDYAALCSVHDANLTISGSNITDISGLNFLTEVTGNLYLNSLTNLSTLNGLENLAITGGYLRFRSLDMLSDLSPINGAGLNIGNGLYIEFNTALTNVDVFDGLSSITGLLIINNNPLLTNVDGFDDLTSISSYLSVSSNPLLTNLNGFVGLTSIGSYLSVNSNSSLTDCSGICTLINGGVASSISISNNPSECSSPIEVELFCQANPCYSGNLTLDTQAEIDAYVATYSACATHDGNLTISGSNITDISELNFLTEVTGNLYLNSLTNLSTLNGLENLAITGGYLRFRSLDMLSDLSPINGAGLNIGNGLYIEFNTALTNVDVFDGLSSITGLLIINNNPLLTNVDGFDDLQLVSQSLNIYNNSSLVSCGSLCLLFQAEGVQGFINISSNPAFCSSQVEIETNCAPNPCAIGNKTLSSQAEVTTFINDFSGCDSLIGSLTISGDINDLSGLNFIEYLSGYLNFSTATVLTDVSGFSALEIQGNMTISNCDAMSSLSGIDEISLGSSLRIENCDALIDISQLSSVTSINNDLYFSNNDLLVSLTGLDNITSVNGKVTVINHASLTDCSAICNMINVDGIAGTTNIYANPSECSSQTEVVLRCTPAGCPPSDITLNSQIELDAFVEAYGSCPVFPGNLSIRTSAITDISSLSFLITIQGDLILYDLDQISSLAGLANVTTIAGDFFIDYSAMLTSLATMNQLTSVTGDIGIRSNPLLQDVGLMSGLSNIRGFIDIRDNIALTDVSSLNNITTVDDYFQLYNNDQLTDVDALSTLVSVGGNLFIQNNDALVDCSGICTIINNGGVDQSTYISGNPAECSSPSEVTTYCNAGNCPLGSVTLSSQNEVDAFVNTYGTCDSIFGTLLINGGSINNLSGLSFLNYVQGDFRIISNPLLLDLSGLNINRVDGHVEINNNVGLIDITALSSILNLGTDVKINNNTALSTLSGLEQLASVNGFLDIQNNAALISLSALSQITSISGYLQIRNNALITSLNGISNVTSIGSHLYINNNIALTDCSAICNLINIGGVVGSVSISNNPSECSSLTEVTTLCTDTDCPEGTVTLSTQVEVDAFVNTFFGCDSMPGGLTIYGNNNITDISGLTFLNHIGGNLIIQYTNNITDLSGLNNIESVAGELKINGNDNLASIAQLSKLVSVASHFRITYNDLLPDIMGLEQLATIGGNLNISQNNTLGDCSSICDLINNAGIAGSSTISGNPSQCSSFSEVSTFCTTSDCPSGDVILNTQNEVDAFIAIFSTCDSLPGDLLIKGNQNITDISGLSFITYIVGDLRFESNQQLTSLDGLQNITGVGGDLRVYNNDQLIHIDDYASIDTIGGQLYIYDNDALINVNGIMDVDTIIGNITVRYNDALVDCDGLCSIINDNLFGGSITISSNPSECSSLTEVTTFCTTEACPPGDVTLSSQIEVDAFVSIFSTCDSLPGSLVISGGNSITDLSGLSFITQVEGDLILNSNYIINDLSGFQNLVKVIGDFKMTNNHILSGISELSMLTDVGGEFSIYNNDSLKMLTGIEQLATIGSHLRIQQNATLSDCTGLCDLLDNGSIGGNTIISYNPSQCSTVDEVQALCVYGSLISTVMINNLPDTIGEGNTLNFEIAVDYAPIDFLNISLTSSNSAEIPVPQTVTIAPGQTFVPVSIALPDNAFPEQNKNITITAGAPYLQPASEVTLLSDEDDIPAITIELLQDTISESAGYYATTGLIKRMVDDGSIINVRLHADVGNVLILPEGVSLSATELEKQFFIGALDNGVVDGFKDVEVTAKYYIPSCNCDASLTSPGIDSESLVVSDDDGPSLSLQVDPLSLQEDQANAGNLIVERNTSTATDLIVNLNSSDLTELSLPATVTIPQGSSTVSVPMTTLPDPITDGNQEVTIQANAAGFAPGNIWVIVTDINKPDFKIADIALTELSAPSIDQFEFRLFITNEGLAAAPTGAKITGYLSKDAFLDDNDFIIGEYTVDAPIQVGDTLELPDLGVTPFQPRDYYLFFEVNSDEALTELLYLNNRSEPILFSVLPDYLGSAFADQDLYPRGDAITIFGSSFKPDNTPVPNADLDVYITVNQVRRELSVTTDSLGDYETVFEPLPYESGHYAIGASYPEQGAQDFDDEYDIVGFKVNNNQYLIWETLLNDPQNGTISIENLSGTPLTNVTFVPEFLPPGLSLSFTPIANLPAYGTADINYSLTGSEITTILDYIEIPLQINSTELSDIQEFTAFYFCQAQQGHLRSEISSINTTMNKDNSRILEFMIFNDGMGETQDVEVILPDVRWLKLVSPSPIASMQPGDTSIITLDLIPSLDLPLNTPGQGNMVINATNGNNLNIPFTIEKVSDETGGVIIDVIDQYTYFTEEAPHVEGATVKITHYFTGEVFGEGVTDADGLFEVSDIPEGTHRVVVQAEDHFGYDGLLVINPGVTREESIFIEYQTISFSWDVVPTTIEDEYQIDLIIEFETNVPAPVVLIEAPDTMPQLFGSETFPFFVTMTNVGLITAREVEMILPDDDPEYIFVTNYEPQDILAQQAIQIPVEMKRRDAPLLSSSETNAYENVAKFLGIAAPSINGKRTKSGGGCNGGIQNVYWYECGPNGIYQQGAHLFSYERSCGGGGTSVPNIFGGGGGAIGGGYPGGPDGGCTDCGVGSDVPSVNIDCKCNDCLKNWCLTVKGCVPGPAGFGAGVASCIVSPGLISCGSIFLPTPIGCALNVINTAIDCGFGASGGSFKSDKHLKSTNQFPSAFQQPADDIYIYYQMIQSKYDQNIEYYGVSIVEDENIVNIGLALDEFIVQQESISATDSIQILNELSGFDIDLAIISAFIQKWNDTMEAWSISIFSPNAQYPNIVDKVIIDDLQLTIDDGIVYIANRGFASIEDMVAEAVSEIDRVANTDDLEESAFNPVCASVTIQISQTLTMVREAFEGTLTVYNGHPTDALQNLSLDLEIIDANGVLSNDLFSIETTELNTLTEIDGTGSLASDADGFAKVLFIPEPGAAPQTPQAYSFGGTISYLDPFSGLMVTLPLIPVTLTVNPSPDLFLHYFMQRDIYGDDPLTDPIEPIIPADLAVMIENNGYGIAQQVVIESAQPEIIDNEKGLAVNFELIGSNLQGEPFTLGLNTINFGDIDPFMARIGQWYFTSSLLGHFTSYETNVVHLDSRGNPDLSLVSGAEIHELVHTISVYGSADDSIDDFLINDIADTEDHPEAIYLSQGNLVYDVFPAFTGDHTGNILAAGNTTTLTVDPLGIGWNYIKLDDPGHGNFEIISVTRLSDGQEIPLKNVWLTHVTIPDGGVQFYEDKFHFVDDFQTFDPETYTVVWSPLDPNPPAIASITGHPSELTADQVTTLRVIFTEEIIESSFGIEDLLLTYQGGADLIDGSVIITMIDSVTYDIDIASLTTGNGYYVFTAQAAGVQDLTGTNGTSGEQATWTQFLSVPVIQEFIGLPDDYIASAFDTVRCLFNVPIDVSTITTADLKITLGGVDQTGTLTLTPLGTEDRLFKIEGLGSFLSSDDTYLLEIDLTDILSDDQVSGLTVQTIPLILDTAPPTVTNLVKSNAGGIDEQHYTKMTINFSEEIEPFDSSAISLSFDGVSQEILSTDLNKVDDDWYEIIWADSLSYPEGDYEFSIDMTKVVDLADNAGGGSNIQNWTVDRTPELVISNLNISPDLGFSSTDGITSVLAVDLSFNISEDARDIFIYQNDNGLLNLLNGISSAVAGTHTFPLTFPTGGQTIVEVWMEDLGGNAVMAEKILYLDESKLSAVWDLEEELLIANHPSAIDLIFSDDVIDLNSIPADLLSWTKDANVLDNSQLSLSKQMGDLYQLTGLTMTENIPGIYQLGVDLSYFTKNSSGVKGTDFVYISWEILDPNQAPISIAGIDMTVNSPMSLMLDGDDSFDPDGDQITYKWYPPVQVSITDSFVVNPSFDIDQSDHEEVYTFLLEVSDGEKNHTDNIRIMIDLMDSINIVQGPVMEYCETDSIDLTWETFGDVSGLNIMLSDNGGTSFTIPIASDIDAGQAAYKVGLNGLEGSSFVLMIEDTISNGFNKQSQLFSILASDATFLQEVTCDINQVGMVSQTLTNQYGCDSIVTTETIYDDLKPLANCVSALGVELLSDGTRIITAAQLDNGSSDNCGLDQMYIDIPNQDCDDVGNKMLTLFVEDLAGNLDSCIVMVTVSDSQNYCSCITDDMMINDVPIASEIYRAKVITSTGLAEDDSNIEFRAKTSVDLKAGFEVEQGAVFHAYIVDCN